MIITASQKTNRRRLGAGLLTASGGGAAMKGRHLARGLDGVRVQAVFTGVVWKPVGPEP